MSHHLRLFLVPNSWCSLELQYSVGASFYGQPHQYFDTTANRFYFESLLWEVQFVHSIVCSIVRTVRTVGREGPLEEGATVSFGVPRLISRCLMRKAPVNFSHLGPGMPDGPDEPDEPDVIRLY